MHIWQLQDAKAKLTQLIKDAKLNPQIISRHGRNETVVLNIEKYQELVGKKETLISFFKASPLNGIGLELNQRPFQAPKVDL